MSRPVPNRERLSAFVHVFTWPLATFGAYVILRYHGWFDPLTSALVLWTDCRTTDAMICMVPPLLAGVWFLWWVGFLATALGVVRLGDGEDP